MAQPVPAPSKLKVHVASEPGVLSGLREQIKANAGVLFARKLWGPPQEFTDVVVLQPESQEGHQEYRAILINCVGGSRENTLASGPLRPTILEALEGLLLLTTKALGKYESKVLQEMGAPVDIEDYGTVDGEVIVGKEWKLFGGRSKDKTVH